MQQNPAVLFCVYRRRNARHVTALLRDLPSDWQVALWGLDGVSRRLARHTVGTGPGAKFELLNTLYEQQRPPPGLDIVVADDDVSFIEKAALLGMMDVFRRAGFALAMPGHAPKSPHSFGITRAVPGCIARSTTFVEIGPLFVVGAAARPRVLPFPPDIGMGWGLELQWHELVAEGHRLGIIDAWPIRHRGGVAAAYDDAPERARLAAAFASRGLHGWEAVQTEVARWRVGEAQPPWPVNSQLGDAEPAPPDQSPDPSG